MSEQGAGGRAAHPAAKAPMRVHWLQHAEHEGLGSIGPWLARQGHRVTGTRLHRGEALPPAGAVDWLIVMGGPMNIYQHERHPWLVAEKSFINDVCVKNKKILGVCLGAQLLADVLGARITKNAWTEIGWFDIILTKEGCKSSLLQDFPATFEAFHWHGDTFSLPEGTLNLMKSDACVNQAFASGPWVGLQFHLEVRAQDARRWLALEAPATERYVQSAAEILRNPARFRDNNRLMGKLLGRLAAL